MKMIRLNERQKLLLSILEKKGALPISSVVAEVAVTWAAVSKITLIRDLVVLSKSGFVLPRGKGRSAHYVISPRYALIKPLDVVTYFKQELDSRSTRTRFNFDVFSLLKTDVFTDHEKKILETLDKGYRDRVRSLAPTLLRQELERLTIELSWKSSQIEGNTYTLLETERLIRERKKAPGHDQHEATMILDHKRTLDFIREHQRSFSKLSIPKIETIQALLIQGLGIPRNIRKSAVGIVGTRYMPLANSFQIREALEKTCKLVNREKNVFAKAILLMVLIAYIQPFEDGNKRTSRLTGNAILMAHGSCPLSYRSVNEGEYKKAVILFYEQQNLTYFKQLFIEQFEFAVKNYFQA